MMNEEEYVEQFRKLKVGDIVFHTARANNAWRGVPFKVESKSYTEEVKIDINGKEREFKTGVVYCVPAGAPNWVNESYSFYYHSIMTEDNFMKEFKKQQE